jgi:hypothetical protein
MKKFKEIQMDRAGRKLILLGTRSLNELKFFDTKEGKAINSHLIKEEGTDNLVLTLGLSLVHTTIFSSVEKKDALVCVPFEKGFLVVVQNEERTETQEKPKKVKKEKKEQSEQSEYSEYSEVILTSNTNEDDVLILKLKKNETMLKRFSKENIIIGDSWKTNGKRYFRINPEGKFRLSISDSTVENLNCFKYNNYFLCIPKEKIKVIKDIEAIKPVEDSKQVEVILNEIADITDIKKVIAELQRLTFKGFEKINFSSKLILENGGYYSSVEIKVS